MFRSQNAVIAHIENLDHIHLNMTQELFDFYSKGQGDTDNIGNIQKLIETNLKMLSELSDKQTLVKHETVKLKTDIQMYSQVIREKMENCIRSNKEHKFGAFFQNQSVLDEENDVANFNTSSDNILKPVSLSN